MPDSGGASDSYVRHQLKQDLRRGIGEAFDGSNPERYWAWKFQLMEHIREAKCTSREVLLILESNTQGQPRETVRDFLYTITDSCESLETVIASLDAKYGSDAIITRAINSKLDKFTKVTKANDTTRMEKLLSLLRYIMASMKACPELAYLNFREGQKKIWQRMPDEFIRRWRKISAQSERNDNRPPTLQRLYREIYNFVNDHSDPAFYDIASPSRNKRSLVTNASEATPTNVRDDGSKQSEASKGFEKWVKPDERSTTKPRCVLHKSSNTHTIYDCKKFASMTLPGRRTVAKEEKLCYNCLSGTHLSRDCDASLTCSVCSAVGHHELMHDASRHRPKVEKIENQANNESETSTRKQDKETSASCCTKVCDTEYRTPRCCSKTVPVEIRVKGSGQTLSCFAIIDEQSDETFCDPKIPELLGLNPPAMTYTLTTMSGLRNEHKGVIVDNIQIRGMHQGDWFTLPRMLSNPYIPDTSHQVATRRMVESHSHIAQFAARFPQRRPDLEVLLLIGVNCGEAMSPRSYGATYPFVHRTVLGWSLVGPVCLEASSSSKAQPKVLRTGFSCEHFTTTQCTVEPKLSDFIPRDFPVFKSSPDDDELAPSREDQQFIEKLKLETTVNSRGNIEMPLPWKIGAKLKDNSKAVYARTNNTLKKIAKDPKIAESCQSTMQKYLDAGHVEELSTDAACSSTGSLNYIAIFPVYQAKKNKTRLVFDGSACYYGQSLNDALLRGPDVANRLIGVLLRFREHRVPFSADIECMFHAFYVTERDRDALRFYWWSQNNPSNKLATFRANVHIFGNRSSPAVSTFGLRYTTTHPEAKTLTGACKMILENFYVDDLLGSASDSEEAIKLLTDARFILSKYNIRLHKIVSPDPKLLASFPRSELAPDIDSVDISTTPLQAALGVSWKIDSDVFQLKFQEPKRDFTKRGILSVIGSIFDPLGLASPVSLWGRLLQRKFITPQKDKRTSYDWDEPLPAEFRAEWDEWLSHLQELSRLTIPRALSRPGVEEDCTFELHTFTDASCEAIGHVIYLKASRAGTHTLSFVFGSSKVVPRAATTIPRAELNAALEGSQSARYIASELRLDILKMVCYTDSRIVLGYLNNTERSFSKYVTTRVSLILKTTSSEDWKYVSTRENPADIATHPCTPGALAKSRWFGGPDFLRNDHDEEISSLGEMEDLPETVEDTKSLVTSKHEDHTLLSRICSRTNSWSRAVNIVRHILAFVRKCRRRHLSVPSVEEAQDFLVLQCQRESFPEEYHDLTANRPIRRSSPLLRLSPFLDNKHIIRVGGRLSDSDLPYDEKHPKLLPTTHNMTKMIVSHAHGKVYHQGRFLTTAKLRQLGYHILRTGKAVCAVISGCSTCGKLRHSPRPQLMSDLPPERLENTPPFLHSGIDVFGPYSVHDGQNTRRSTSTKKIWVLLVTCLYSRAVHLEPLCSLDISSLRLALRRFVALRGECVLYRSDCGTNFIANNNLSEVEWSELVSGNYHSPKWKFLPPRASHMAGVWERKVGAIKSILNVTMGLLGKRNLSREDFTTLLLEAASTVNHTPLAEVSADPNDPYPVSPACLLNLRSTESMTVPPSTEDDILAYGKRRWRRVNYLAEQFSTRWRRDYLHSLQVRRKWLRPSRNIEVGDVVVIKQETQRNTWPLGIVTETKANRDGFVRSATVQLKPSKSGSNKFLDRAVHDLVVVTTADKPSPADKQTPPAGAGSVPLA